MHTEKYKYRRLSTAFRLDISNVPRDADVSLMSVMLPKIKLCLFNTSLRTKSTTQFLQNQLHITKSTEFPELTLSVTLCTSRVRNTKMQPDYPLLPDDILLRIVRYLPEREQQQFSMVS